MDSWQALLILSFVFVGGVQSSSAAPSNFSEQVRAKIKDGYDAWVRPVEQNSDRVDITFGTAIYQLINFDAKSETLQTLMWTEGCWNDYNVAWDPAQYGNLEIVRLYQDDIWTPDLVPYNDIGGFDTQKYKYQIPLRGWSDGRVCWNFPTIMNTICSLDVTDFPFDKQTCQITLGSWQYPAKEVELFCKDEGVDTSSYAAHSQWDLKDSSCDEDLFKASDGTPFSSLIYTMKFQRLDSFYIRNLILPNGILLALSSLIFFLPSEDSGRIGFGMTVTLSLFFNLVIVFDYIPETSKTFPSLCTYFLVSICLTSFSVLLAAISVNIFNATDDHDSKPEESDGKTYVVPEPEKRKKCGRDCLTKDMMKLIDRIAGVCYFIATTIYTLSILWKTF